MKLFTVGPVACFPQILEEMKHQMFSHRSTEYTDIHRETVERLQDFLETKEQVFLFPSSGSGIMEASIRNCVNQKILCCVSGAFGKRYSRDYIWRSKKTSWYRTCICMALWPRRCCGLSRFADKKVHLILDFVTIWGIWIGKIKEIIQQDYSPIMDHCWDHFFRPWNYWNRSTSSTHNSVSIIGSSMLFEGFWTNAQLAYKP